MTASERPAPATGTGPSENVAAKLGLAGQSSAARRDHGIARADESTDAWTRSCWQTAINYWASTGVPFGADECRELGVPEPKSPGAVGAWFYAACRRGVIKPHSFVQSVRPSRHRSWQRQWIGADAAA